MATWNDVTEEQFVNMVHERPALYDSNDRNYNNRSVKAQLWGDIELKLHTSEKEMKRRWESLRTQYVRYQKLPLTGRTSRQQWILSKLHFLEPHTKTKESLSMYSDKESFAGDIDCQSVAHSDAPWTSALLEVCSQSPTPETAPLDSPGLPLSESMHTHTHSRLSEVPPAPACERPRAKRFRKEEPPSETAANLIAVINRTLEQLSQEKQEEDGISLYLKYLEHRLRMLPQHHLPRLQRDIENILYTYSVEENKMDL
ncbi:uncharacterized protein [Eucyclogobius newberryi]|uniref:uncharacterized protein n=1 Tax=Eucyclogobius newberryi TaxID=166745 RepID=UPI003B59C3CF